MKRFLDKVTDVMIEVKGEEVVLLSADEIARFIANVHGKQFKNRANATFLTQLSYLGGVNSSSKISKGLKMDYNTYIVYLNPYKNLFGNVCPKATTCIDTCLNTSGRVKMDVKEFKILRARYLKTVLFYVNRNFFNAWLFAEIDAHSQRLPNFMVRLNGTSDLNPMLMKVDGVNVLQQFPNVQFYDYTKLLNRTLLTTTYSNYHLTFSYDGINMDECLLAMKLGINVSVVIDGKMPKTFKGKEVFSMDETDLRPLDTLKGAFGYLKLKETLNKKYDSRFVVTL